jgi:MtN3 and saliva related transmembrane protein
MDISEMIGIIAGIATTGSFIPQAYKVFKTKRTHDLSTGMFILLISGIIMWIIYGLLYKALPIIAANSVTLVLAIYIFVMKIKHG